MHRHAYTQIHIQTHTHAYKQTHTYKDTHTDTCTHIHTCFQASMNTEKLSRYTMWSTSPIARVINSIHIEELLPAKIGFAEEASNWKEAKCMD